ncbi:MAG: hypothetical protein ACFCUI_06185 [Bernardetiaceae bacterium]
MPTANKSFQTTLYYIAPNGDRYNGQFIITEDLVRFEAQMHLASDGIKDVEGQITIRREDIASVVARSSYLIFKRLLIQCHDGSSYLFDRGVVSVRPILNLLQQ